jgi:hypothetical protein
MSKRNSQMKVKSLSQKSALLATFMLLGLSAQKGFAQHNALTPAEKASGYQQLFNGTDLEGWRSYNSTTPPNSWKVVPESTWNVLFVQAGTPRSSLISSDMSFRNFDLLIEWNIASGGNSGIFMRYNKHNINEWGGASGPESQIAANNNSDGSDPIHRAGACYDMLPLLDKAKTWDGIPNYGKWQQFRIVAFEGHVAHFGNGIKLLEYVIKSPAWNTAYNSSKYATYPDYGNVHPGSIYLQHHGEFGANGPKFRDIRIKTLTENPWAVGSKYLVSPNDTTSLKDLAFTDLLFPKTTGLISAPNAGEKFSIFSSQAGYRLRFEKSGDYQIHTQDWLGRTGLSRSFHNANEAWLPSESARDAKIISVWSGKTRIHVGPLPTP